jgi:hypothetical protein
MSKNIIFVLMYYGHKLLDLMEMVWKEVLKDQFI